MTTEQQRPASLTEGLATEVRRARGGECPESALVLLRDDQLPKVQITDSNGLVANKVISYADLLAALDESSVVKTLEDDNRRTSKLPALPQGALLVDMHEEPNGRSFTLTGYVPPQSYLFCLESRNQQETRTYEIPLPYLVYSVLYDEESASVRNFALTLCSPELGYPEREHSELGHTRTPAPGEEQPSSPAGLLNDEGPPGPQTPLYRYTFSNVYPRYGDFEEGVCWPTMGRIATDLKDVPVNIVRAFLELPNNNDLYGRGLSHNGPQESYTALLEHVEATGLPHDYLIPAAMSVQGLHDQRRDLQ